jgi:hypothetical protein
MANRFSSGKNSIAECDRCGFRFKLTVVTQGSNQDKDVQPVGLPLLLGPRSAAVAVGYVPS